MAGVSPRGDLARAVLTCLVSVVWCCSSLILVSASIMPATSSACQRASDRGRCLENRVGAVALGRPGLPASPVPCWIQNPTLPSLATKRPSDSRCRCRFLPGNGNSFSPEVSHTLVIGACGNGRSLIDLVGNPPQLGKSLIKSGKPVNRDRTDISLDSSADQLWSGPQKPFHGTIAAPGPVVSSRNIASESKNRHKNPIQDLLLC
jgi:hypothetical protein